MSSAPAQSPSPFRLDTLVAAFEEMRATPGFDVAQPLQWGFFFVATDPAQLAPVQEQLKSDGYVFVESYRDNQGMSWLQLARVETHTPETLHERNQQLFIFASGYPGVTYDGWDVTRKWH